VSEYEYADLNLKLSNITNQKKSCLAIFCGNPISDGTQTTIFRSCMQKEFGVFELSSQLGEMLRMIELYLIFFQKTNIYCGM
jgi:hypothetical protein